MAGLVGPLQANCDRCALGGDPTLPGLRTDDAKVTVLPLGSETAKVLIHSKIPVLVVR